MCLTLIASRNTGNSSCRHLLHTGLQIPTQGQCQEPVDASQHWMHSLKQIKAAPASSLHGVTDDRWRPSIHTAVTLPAPWPTQFGLLLYTRWHLWLRSVIAISCWWRYDHRPLCQVIEASLIPLYVFQCLTVNWSVYCSTLGGAYAMSQFPYVELIIHIGKREPTRLKLRYSTVVMFWTGSGKMCTNGAILWKKI